MTKALTQEEFIAKANKVHNFTYSYDKTVYTRSNVKVTVTCPKEGHGDWDVTPNNHLKRKCPKCACSFTNARDSFIPKAKEIFGDLYDYSEVEYLGATVKVKVKCKIHDTFLTTPSNHLNGFGCAKCGYAKMAKSKTKTLQEYLSDARAVHGDKFGLGKIVYSDCRDKIVVECFDHGDFSVQANSFLQGHGCPSCMEGGYNQMKAGKLYALICDNICKIGITNQSAEDRARHINKMSKLEFSPIYEGHFDNGSIPLEVETALLRELRRQYRPVEMKFNGSTECFYDVDQGWLLSRIEELIEEQHATN